MAVCRDCGREMRTATSCSFGALVIEGKTYERVFYGAEPGERATHRGQPCHDCGVGVGGYHHFGCDWERCPHCGGQLITCQCADEIVVVERIVQKSHRSVD